MITAKRPHNDASSHVLSNSLARCETAIHLFLVAIAGLILSADYAHAQVRIQSAKDVTPVRLNARPTTQSQAQSQRIKITYGKPPAPVAIREVKTGSSTVTTKSESNLANTQSPQGSPEIPEILVQEPTNPDSVLLPTLADPSNGQSPQVLESNLEETPVDPEILATPSARNIPRELPVIDFQPLPPQPSQHVGEIQSLHQRRIQGRFFQTSLLAQQPIANLLDCGSPPCADAAERLKATPLGSISLDISPSFKPNLTEKPARLQEEIRQWKNRNGMAIVTGRLADFRFEQVHIADEAGAITTIPISELAADDFCYVADTWGFPMHCRIDNQRFSPRQWKPITLAWKASELHHHPLYFEDAELERYGHTLGAFAQPFKSGAHFFLNIAVAPYNMALEDPKDLRYALGYYRPGSSAPRLIPAIPWSTKAALWQAGAIVGGWALIP